MLVWDGIVNSRVADLVVLAVLCCAVADIVALAILCFAVLLRSCPRARDKRMLTGGSYLTRGVLSATSFKAWLWFGKTMCS